MDQLKLLKRTIELAEIALDKGSVPIGAVIADKNGEIISEGFNEIKLSNDPTAHAEVICMRKANIKIVFKHNPDSTFLFTILEPCFACAFFVTRTNIRHITWALDDPYKGGVKFLMDSEKMQTDFKTIELNSEPDAFLRDKSKELMKKYYTNKGDFQTASIFS